MRHLPPCEKRPGSLGYPREPKGARRIRRFPEKQLAAPCVDDRSLVGNAGRAQLGLGFEKCIQGVAMTGLDPVHLRLEFLGTREEEHRYARVGCRFGTASLALRVGPTVHASEGFALARREKRRRELRHVFR